MLGLETSQKERLLQETSLLLQTLFPICRSITGNGVRETLNHIKQRVPGLKIEEVPTGTACYDWEIPKEWNIRDAYILDSKGTKLIDFQQNNLHVVNYSKPINEFFTFEALKSYLHTLPELPDAIPYRTTYYKENWGFCLTHRQFLEFDPKETYQVVIDSDLTHGSLTYAHAFKAGESPQEILLSTYCCHPSLANDNLSGLVLASLLFQELSTRETHYSYRLAIVPETIGAISYMKHHQDTLSNTLGGFVITTVAGPGPFGYKHSFHEKDHLIDRAVKKTFLEKNIDYIPYPFDVYGSDETHYAAPAFRIPTGTITKDKYYEYDYYHTSLDNLDFIQPAYLLETLELYLSAIEKLEMEGVYQSLTPHCQPMLGKRGLYPSMGGGINQNTEASSQPDTHKINFLPQIKLQGNQLDAILWLMFYSDGTCSLLDISDKTGIPMKELYTAAELLRKHDLLERLSDENTNH